MAACTFFGHRECCNLDSVRLCQTIDELIACGVDTFYVGSQGQFDSTVYSHLKQLRKKHPHIRVCVVLAYLPSEKHPPSDTEDTMYPEIEGHPKFAIERRNRWMIEQSEYCVCCINHSWGGAYKFARTALRHGKKIINLGNMPIA